MTTVDHNGDLWELARGDWIWSCLTCLDKGIAADKPAAEVALAEHLAQPVPWWAIEIAERAARA